MCSINFIHKKYFFVSNLSSSWHSQVGSLDQFRAEKGWLNCDVFNNSATDFGIVHATET